MVAGDLGQVGQKGGCMSQLAGLVEIFLASFLTLLRRCVCVCVLHSTASTW